MRRLSPASILHASAGSRPISSMIAAFATCSSSVSSSACAETMYGLPMNITASPKLWRGPTSSTTFSAPWADTKASLTWP